MECIARMIPEVNGFARSGQPFHVANSFKHEHATERELHIDRYCICLLRKLLRRSVQNKASFSLGIRFILYAFFRYSIFFLIQ